MYAGSGGPAGGGTRAVSGEHRVRETETETETGSTKRRAGWAKTKHYAIEPQA
jgi:hypothetical protein